MVVVAGGGLLNVHVHTDDPEERFTPGTEFATEPDRGMLTLRSVRVHQQIYLLGFEGVPDRTAAEALGWGTEGGDSGRMHP